MGVLIDTGVFIESERDGRDFDSSPWGHLGELNVSVITLSELLVGVLRSDTETRRTARVEFVDRILKQHQVLSIDPLVARVHASLYAALAIQGTMIGAHDLWIAATAINHGHTVLTTNPSEFIRVPGIQMIDMNHLRMQRPN